MRGLRRAVLALALGLLVSLVVRLRGDTTPPPPTRGGWRELQGPDLR
jgi:hypothetical protein